MCPEPIGLPENIPVELDLSNGLAKEGFVVFVDSIVCEEGWCHVGEIGPVSERIISTYGRSRIKTRCGMPYQSSATSIL